MIGSVTKMSSVTPSKALLIIIGEPLVEEHVNAILGRVTEGMRIGLCKNLFLFVRGSFGGTSAKSRIQA